jgi:hypothetical protein
MPAIRPRWRRSWQAGPVCFTASMPRCITSIAGSAAEQPPPGRPDPGHLIGTTWLYLGQARSGINRGRLWRAERMVTAARNEVLALACQRLAGTPPGGMAPRLAAAAVAGEVSGLPGPQRQPGRSRPRIPARHRAAHPESPAGRHRPCRAPCPATSRTRPLCGRDQSRRVTRRSVTATQDIERTLADPPNMYAGHGGLLLPGGAHERVFCAAHCCRPLIVIGGSKELGGMARGWRTLWRWCLTGFGQSRVTGLAAYDLRTGRRRMRGRLG